MQKRAGIYIHIPFCERKCTYCNFNTTDFFDSLAARYVEAVSLEIKGWGERLSRHETPGGNDRLSVDSIYFGGGTPSIIEAAQVAALVESCHEAFDVARDAEITIEINPATISRNRIEGWIGCGINRASVGVQSFIDSELVALSRTHAAADARRTIESLREAGMENISLDLIAGLPGQTLSDWEFNLREALKIRPEHMSLYLLEVKEGTQLLAQIKRGQRPLPDDDLAAEMYRMICDAARDANYEHYEISNFALWPGGAKSGGDFTPSPLRSKHNMKYWTGAAFYGMGCGAHSYDSRTRWMNILKAESYIASITSTGQAIAERHEMTDEDRAAEALFMGLRLKEGVSLGEFRAEYGVDVLSRYGQELPRLEEAGLIEIDAERLTLTATGRLLSNEVFVSFV
ncbi:MAG TPA: radical SAM family heme chaperone HemW [Blastocatellia bacterium]